MLLVIVNVAADAPVAAAVSPSPAILDPPKLMVIVGWVELPAGRPAATSPLPELPDDELELETPVAVEPARLIVTVDPPLPAFALPVKFVLELEEEPVTVEKLDEKVFVLVSVDSLVEVLVLVDVLPFPELSMVTVLATGC